MVKKTIPPNATIRQQARKCGRDCPRCPHGPYWYAYWRGPDGRLRSAYIGSAKALATLRASWRTKPSPRRKTTTKGVRGAVTPAVKRA